LARLDKVLYFMVQLRNEDLLIYVRDKALDKALLLFLIQSTTQ